MDTQADTCQCRAIYKPRTQGIRGENTWCARPHSLLGDIIVQRLGGRAVIVYSGYAGRCDAGGAVGLPAVVQCGGHGLPLRTPGGGRQP